MDLHLESYAYVGDHAKNIAMIMKAEIKVMMREGLIGVIGEWWNWEGTTRVISEKIIHYKKWESAIHATIFYRFTPEEKKLIVYHEFYIGGIPRRLAFPLNQMYVQRDLKKSLREWLMIAITEPLETRMQRFEDAFRGNEFW